MSLNRLSIYVSYTVILPSCYSHLKIKIFRNNQLQKLKTNLIFQVELYAAGNPLFCISYICNESEEIFMGELKK